MAVSFAVPRPVRLAAERALELHRKHSLPEVSGVSVAKALVSGDVSPETLQRQRRFFRTSERLYRIERDEQRGARDSALVRSWDLYGADAGRLWAERTLKAAIREGDAEEDPIDALLQAPVEEVYDRFALGAWRFEFGLTPRSAARFVETYLRSTGNTLDLGKAFGEGADAVSRAMYRRYHGPNPFRAAARLLESVDADYRMAARLDLDEMPTDDLDESMKPIVFNAAGDAPYRNGIWASWVAYWILASERPSLLKSLNKTSKKPPALDGKVASLFQFNDAISTFITYFHPEGSRYKDPTGTKFEGVDKTIEEMILRAWYGKKVVPSQIKKMLGEQRRWTASTKLAGGQFHILIAAWKKGDWQTILDTLPEDADVREAFKEFHDENPMPADGITVQQTLTDKKLRGFVRSQLLLAELIEEGDELVPVKMNATLLGKRAKAAETPFGVYSVLECLKPRGGFNVGIKQGERYASLGAWAVSKGTAHVLLKVGAKADATILAPIMPDTITASAFKSGDIKVVAAHKDLPGSVYGSVGLSGPKPDVDSPEPEAPQAEVPTTDDAPDPTVDKDTLPDDAPVLAWAEENNYAPNGYLVRVKLSETEFGKAAYEKFGQYPGVSESWTRKWGETSKTLQFPLVGIDAEATGHPVRIVFRDEAPDGPFMAISDEMAAAQVEGGELLPTEMDVEVEDPFGFDDDPTVPTQAVLDLIESEGLKTTAFVPWSVTSFGVAAQQKYGDFPDVSQTWQLSISDEQLINPVCAAGAVGATDWLVFFQDAETGGVAWLYSSVMVQAMSAGNLSKVGELGTLEPLSVPPVLRDWLDEKKGTDPDGWGSDEVEVVTWSRTAFGVNAFDTYGEYPDASQEDWYHYDEMQTPLAALRHPNGKVFVFFETEFTSIAFQQDKVAGWDVGDGRYRKGQDNINAVGLSQGTLDAIGHNVPIPWKKSQTGQACHEKYGVWPHHDQEWFDHETREVWSLEAAARAVQSGVETIRVYSAGPTGAILPLDDAAVAKYIKEDRLSLQHAEKWQDKAELKVTPAGTDLRPEVEEYWNENLLSDKNVHVQEWHETETGKAYLKHYGAYPASGDPVQDNSGTTRIIIDHPYAVNVGGISTYIVLKTAGKVGAFADGNVASWIKEQGKPDLGDAFMPYDVADFIVDVYPHAQDVMPVSLSRTKFGVATKEQFGIEAELKQAWKNIKQEKFITLVGAYAFKSHPSLTKPTTRIFFRTAEGNILDWEDADLAQLVKPSWYAPASFSPLLLQGFGDHESFQAYLKAEVTSGEAVPRAWSETLFGIKVHEKFSKWPDALDSLWVFGDPNKVASQYEVVGALGIDQADVRVILRGKQDGELYDYADGDLANDVESGKFVPVLKKDSEALSDAVQTCLDLYPNSMPWHWQEASDLSLGASEFGQACALKNFDVKPGTEWHKSGGPHEGKLTYVQAVWWKGSTESPDDMVESTTEGAWYLQHLFQHEDGKHILWLDQYAGLLVDDKELVPYEVAQSSKPIPQLPPGLDLYLTSGSIGFNLKGMRETSAKRTKLAQSFIAKGHAPEMFDPGAPWMKGGATPQVYVGAWLLDVAENSAHFEPGDSKNVTVQGKEYQIIHVWQSTPSDLFTAFYDDPSIAVSMQPVGGKSSTVPSLKYQPGDVVKWQDVSWWILAILEEETPTPKYIVSSLYAFGHSSSPTIVPAKGGKLETQGTWEANVGTIADVANHMAIVGKKPETPTIPVVVGVGTAIKVAYVPGGVAHFVGEVYHGDQALAVCVYEMSVKIKGQDVTYPSGTTVLSSSITSEQVSDYNPPDLTPEDPFAADTPDDEVAGQQEMSGTQDAFDYLKKKKGWKPATKSQSTEFQYALGGKHMYGSVKSRTIIGYGFSDKGKPVYLTKTEVGNVSFSFCSTAKKKYDSFAFEQVQGVLDNLLPLPDAPPPKYPKLNYKLTKHSKKVAEAEDLVYVPKPDPNPCDFHVGSRIVDKNGDRHEILGWVGDDAGVNVALWNPKTPTSAWYAHSAETVNEQFSLKYAVGTSSVAHKDSAGKDVFDITLGKGATNDSVTLQIPGVEHALTSNNAKDSGYYAPDGWDEPDPVKQPPIDALPKAHHVSAGIIAILPPGMAASGQGVTTQHPSVVLFHPANEFNGYTIAIPKGTIDKGESIEKAAVREVYEETGLTVKPVAYLGDFKATQSITRLFIGYVTGGSPAQPKNKHEECDAVALKGFPLYSDSAQAKKGYEERVKAALADAEWTKMPWYKQLVPSAGSTWQQEAIDAAAEWAIKVGLPHTSAVDTADDYSQVSTKKIAMQLASQEQALPVSSSAADDQWKSLLFDCPFPITSQIVSLLKLQLAQSKSVLTAFTASDVLPETFKKGTGQVCYGVDFETPAGTPYTMLGYVELGATGKDGVKKVRPFLIASSVGGELVTLPQDEFAGSHALGDQQLTAPDEDAWFTHPDPVTNAAIQKIWTEGASLKQLGTTMHTFKSKWLKAAKVPAYAVTTTKLLHYVAGLFVPGALSQAQRDAILNCLKSRMKATHSGKKAKKAASKTASVQVPIEPPLAYHPKTLAAKVEVKSHEIKEAPTATAHTLPVESGANKVYVDNPQPMLFQATGKKVSGGSKPNQLLLGPGGQKWFFKWGGAGEEFRADIDKSAYQFSELCKTNNIPVGAMEFEGTYGSFQPFAEGSKAPPSNPVDLDDDNMAELLSQHAVDMFMGDHDGHAGNWLSVNGKLRAIDRGQAWKFVLMGKKESLDPSWHAPGNYGSGYAKGLLVAWGKGEVEIPEVAFAEMLRTVKRVKSVDNAMLEGILTPVFEKMGTDEKKRASILKKLQKRRDSYEKDWLAVLKKLRRDFTWPTVAEPAPVVSALKSSPQEQGFTPKEDKIIEEAVAAGWQGKSIRIGGPHIENQEIMVRAVEWEQKAGVKVPATLLHFRVSRPSGLEMTQKLYQNAEVTDGDVLGGPHRLLYDKQNTMWEKLFGAIKSINHHYHAKKDGPANQQTVAAAVGLREELEATLAKANQDLGGIFSKTKEPNVAVSQMCDQYLQYISTIDEWNQNVDDHMGQHSPTFAEYLWEDPPAPEEEVKVKPAYEVVLKKQGALWPTVSSSPNAVIVNNLNKPVINSSMQSQMVITDPVTKAQIYFNPPGGTSLSSVKDGVESAKGQAWAIMPGKPSATTVAHLLKLLETSTGVPMKAATAQDSEALYWSQQAAILQSGGRVKPDSDSTIVKEEGYKKGMEAYRAGNTGEAITLFKKHAASKLNVPVTQLESLPGYNPEGEYTRGAGFRRNMRIGWTRESLIEKMGGQCHLAHHLYQGITDFFQAATGTGGALLANAVRPYYGVAKIGASVGSDFAQGGSQGLFLCFRKGYSSSAGMLYFDLELALRLDVYMVGTGDTFGNTQRERYYTPEQWVSHNVHKKTGTTGSSSPYQINVRHDIDLQQYLVRASCGSATARDKCIQLVTDAGWKFKHGTPDKIFKG